MNNDKCGFLNIKSEFLISKFNGKRGPQRKLSLEHIVSLNIYRFHFKTRDLKNYHKMIKELMSEKVPNLPELWKFHEGNEQIDFECYHIKHRCIIESDWGTLKNNFQLEYHKARSIVGMFRHFFYSIAAHMINRNLDYYQNFFRLRLI